LLKFAVKDFLDDRRLKNLSPASLSAYRFTLDEFHAFAAEHEVVNAEDVTPLLIKQYLYACQEVKRNGTVTLNHKLRNIKVFMNYLVEIGVIKSNPAKGIAMRKEDVHIEAFTDYHIQQMLGYYRRLKQRDKTFVAYRDYTIIVTLLGTGIRLGELCNLRWQDVNFTNSCITVFGKGRRQRTIPMTDKLKRELAEWKAFAEQRVQKPMEYVFVTQTGEGMSVNAVELVFKRLNKIMNFRDVRLSPHTFRHTFAKNWIMAGGDVFTLQKILGHSRLDVTMQYVSLFGSAIKEQNDKYNPLNSMEV